MLFVVSYSSPVVCCSSFVVGRLSCFVCCLVHVCLLFVVLFVFVFCCPLSVFACCVLFVVYVCVLFVSCCALFVIRCSLFFVLFFLFVAC